MRDQKWGVYDPPETPRDSVRELAWKIWNEGDPTMDGYRPGLDELEDLLLELKELRKDKARLDWLESHVDTLSRISRPLNDTLTLEYVSDISGCVAEEETVDGIRVVIDAAMDEDTPEVRQ